MPSIAIIGAQWGDEGKGKVTDYLCENADVVVRFQGGANAGHTVVAGTRTFKLHLMPSGVIRGATSVLAEGMVIDLDTLWEEIQTLRSAGLDPTGRLKISDRAHLVLPHHKKLDAGGGMIGTTARGIGPAYADRSARIGIRAGDLRSDTAILDRIAALWNAHPDQVRDVGWDASAIPDVFQTWRARFAPYLADTGRLIRGALKEGSRVLFEGAQGVLLDLSAGTYPYVTSSYTTAAGVAVGAGIPPNLIGNVFGVSKAYTTRVGQGPFPTELQNELGDRVRAAGNEYGTTTGRPRRCGWLDAVALRYACDLNGFSGLVLTKLDVLTGIHPLHIATEYRIDGARIAAFPADHEALSRVTVTYTTAEGWQEDLSGVRRFENLPPAARRYLDLVAALSGTPLAAVSVGAHRDQTLAVRPIW